MIASQKLNQVMKNQTSGNEMRIKIVNSKSSTLRSIKK